jgi:hypothetical protein
MLQLSDIPKTISTIPTASSSLSGGATLLTHELFTNDVLYAEAALDLTGLPAGLLPLLPLFCRSLTQVGGCMLFCYYIDNICWRGFCYKWFGHEHQTRYTPMHVTSGRLCLFAWGQQRCM